MALRVVFAGTPEFAAVILRHLLASEHEVVAVFTQPDRPSGRGRKVSASAVKLAALDAGIPVGQPPTFRAEAPNAELTALGPDVLVVAAYGLILPESTLEIARHGSLNVHASLLPRWRGAAPIQRAILAGDGETGISIMAMDAGLDTGAVYRTGACRIEPQDTAATLHDRLAAMGGPLLLETLRVIEDGIAKTTPQPLEGVTYAARLRKEEGDIDWQRPALELERQVRAFNPWPVAHTMIPGTPPRRLRLWSASVGPDAEADDAPGTVVSAGRDGIRVATGSGTLTLNHVQIDGGKRVAAADFLNARPLPPGLRLGSRDEP